MLWESTHRSVLDMLTINKLADGAVVVVLRQLECAYAHFKFRYRFQYEGKESTRWTNLLGEHPKEQTFV